MGDPGFVEERGEGEGCYEEEGEGGDLGLLVELCIPFCNPGKGDSLYSQSLQVSPAQQAA